MRRAVGLFLLATFALAPACARDHASVATRAHRIESQVWSPYCTGRLLADCTTQQAYELRTRISDRLGKGQSDAQVMAWLRSDFGDEILARPAPGRAGLVVWLVPIAALIAGALLIVRLVRRWTRRAPSVEREP
jgi:cytochrome c-type biogenesis protein CcmH